jgi:cyclophilin family peptidyl-prolyl cis-trans isomerase
LGPSARGPLLDAWLLGTFTSVKSIVLCLLLVCVGSVPTRAETLVQIRTALGDMVLELFDEEKPVTVQNFLRYVRDGRWTNMFSHRVVPGFIIQGGGFGVTNRGATNVGFTDIPDYGTITNEFGVGPRLSNTFGTVAMAKLGGDPNSASSEWFINLADNSENLDSQNGGFTVFGRIIGGTNLLGTFSKFTWLDTQATNRLYNLVNTGFPFDSRPGAPAFPTLRKLSSYPEVFDNLLFLEVVELPLRVQPRRDGRQGLQWTPVPGVENRVEVSVGMGAAWTPLTNVIPTGPIAMAEDLSTGDGPRFYRVRVGQ